MPRVRRSAKRSYVSPAREAAREETRDAIVAAATAVLRRDGWDGFSVEAVARAAKVTRLTVYNRLGDRRGLLEAVFDAEARTRGLAEIPAAMATADPEEALAKVVRIFCSFWKTSKPMRGVMAAAAGDTEIGRAIAARNERRRKLLRVLVARMVERGDVIEARAMELVDTLFALTSFAFFDELERGASSLSCDDVERVVEALVAAAVRVVPP